MRFALLEAKVAVMSVMKKFSFKPGPKTKIPLELDGESQLDWVKGGLRANNEARTDC